jgi:choline-sulfatase
MAPHAESPRWESQDPFPTRAITNGVNGFHIHDCHAHPGRSAVKQNILFIMADQMSASELRIYNPESKILTPALNKLAEDAVVFESAYCNSPLCAPSRFCLASGKLASKIGAYDNASDFASDVPTFAHALRSEGYETTLAGKMHFIGPDQLHGYENRLTTDIYPADYGWGVNWDKPDERQEWYHNMSSVYQAGVCGVDNQLTYDDEVFYKVSLQSLACRAPRLCCNFMYITQQSCIRHSPVRLPA